MADNTEIDYDSMSDDLFNGSIYAITNDVNDKVYIGLTTRGVENRFNEHIYAALVRDYSGHLYNAIRLYGKNSFKCEVLEENIKTLQELNKTESKYIIKYDSMDNGYNMTSGGDSTKVSDETRINMSNAQKNRFLDEKEKDKLRTKIIGNKYSDPEIFRRMNKEKK